MGHLLETMEKIRAERIANRSFPNNSSKESESIEKDSNSGGNLVNIQDIGEAANDIDKLLIQLKKNEPTSDNQFFRLCIIGYEFGSLQRSIVYSERFKDDEKERRIHLANAKLDIADMLIQIQLLCLTYGWNFDDLRKLGVQHLKERQEDFKINKWSEI